MEHSLQYKEQQLLATIFVCNKLIRQDDNHFVALFESVTGLYGEVETTEIEKFNAIDFENFQKLGENKYAYFKTVQKFVSETLKDTITQLNESQEIDTFKLDLANAIKTFESVDDFNVLDNLDENILKIKIFARKPINVFGYNILDVLEKNDTKLFGEIYSILYNKISKVLYFVVDGAYSKYDIATNEYINYSDDRIKSTNYIKHFKQLINPNIVEIYKNPMKTVPKMDKGFTDNLYSDKARETEIRKIIENGILKK